MKLDPRPQLPSVGELLEHPRVKGIVARINRSTLAQRAAGFLDELKSSLAARIGAGDELSLSHLAERLARRLVGEPTHEDAVINATGVVLGAVHLSPPLAESCLHAIFQSAAEFHRQSHGPTATQLRALCEATGGESAYVATSFEAAATLAVAATSGGREAWLHRGSTDPGEDPMDWGRIAARSGAVLRVEPPSTDSPNRPAAIIRCGDVETTEALPHLAAIAKAHDACLIDVASAAGTINPSRFGLQPVAPIGERLAAGAHLVVVDGAGLIGGPSCGLIVGQQRYVEMVTAHPLASLATASLLTCAALDATVRAYRDNNADSAMLHIPLWQLLSAPIDNLRQRAERLAPLMAESPAVASAESRCVSSAWRRAGPREWVAESWAVVLQPSSEDGRVLRTMLQQGPYPIMARDSEGALALDLRSVFPRWDQRLVEAVVEAREGEAAVK